MALYPFRLPDIGEGVVDAEIVRYHVAVGDQVAEDQLLVDVMTDKSTVEITSPVSGQIVSLAGDVGARVPVGSLLVEIDPEGEASQMGGREATLEQPLSGVASHPEKLAGASARQSEPEARRSDDDPGASHGAAPSGPTRPLASPATRRRALERGIPLSSVRGTGPDGRVTAEDLDRHGSDTPRRGTGVTETKIVGLRRRIAEKMQEATRRIPHFSYVEEFDLSELEGVRQELNAEGGEGRPKLTLLPFFMQGIAAIAHEFPHINALYDDEAGILRSYEGVHIGIATQTSAGLVVPVVRHAEGRDLWDCARELGRVTVAARDGTIAREELTGSTITLTSLGALGGIAATPVINHPEVAIIAPNKLVERPVIKDGHMAVRKMMNLSTSFDHRIVDGYDAAKFVQRLKRLMERPALLFVGPS